MQCTYKYYNIDYLNVVCDIFFNYLWSSVRLSEKKVVDNYYIAAQWYTTYLPLQYHDRACETELNINLDRDI